MMTEIILAVTVSIISLGVMVWAAIVSNKFLKYFIPIVKEVLDERKEF